jgi:hypothetical protein
MRRGPLAQSVDRFAIDTQVVYQQPNRLRRPQCHARIRGAEHALQQRVDVHPLKEGVDDRQRAQRLRGQLERPLDHLRLPSRSVHYRL